MSMRSMLLAVFLSAGCLSLCPAGFAASSPVPLGYQEVVAGIAGAEKETGLSFSLRQGVEYGKYDFSVGFLNLYGMKAAGMKSDNSSLPTINLELTRELLSHDGGQISVGGGFGYTMPNLSGGVNEQADNDISFTAVGAFRKPISNRIDFVISVRGFFFATDSQLTTYGYHSETLSTGQSVEVIEEIHQDSRLNFNSVLFLAGIRW
jgi:hypothetical protein